MLEQDGMITTHPDLATSQPRKGDWMQTYTGEKFWPLDPRVDEIDIIDIAHSLSMQCRYAGHCLKYYSVAEHCVLLAEWLHDEGHSEEAALYALLHDASEAYLVDVPRPVKPFLAGYKEAELRVQNCVWDWAGLSRHVPIFVHDADQRITADEKHENMYPLEWDYVPGPALGVSLKNWEPERAKDEFLDMYYFLTD